MSQVKISPKFFQNEIKAYRNWSMAFWRENLQNSFDAHSSKINITISPEENGITKVIIQDNGIGMTQDTLENVYFNLGETTKTGDSVGGFGRARILTCFSQQKYILKTQKLIVEGCGSDYSINESSSYVEGVYLEIDVITNGTNLEYALNDYLGKCHMKDCSVFVNGQKWTDWTLRNKYERDLSFAHIFTNKSKSPGILVRVNGVHMFSPYTVSPFLVIIEIFQNKSREVLQSSRDGLLYQYQQELESFVNELNINKQSALRKKTSKSIHYRGTGTFSTKRIEKPTIEHQLKVFENLFLKNGGSIEDSEKVKDFVMNSQYKEKALAAVVSEMKFPPEHPVSMAMHKSGYSESAYESNLYSNLFNVFVLDETDSNTKIRRVIESYYPSNWGYGKGGDKQKLLVMWQTACLECIKLLQNNLQFGPEEINWGVGWSFNEDGSEALHKTSAGTHWLLLNPVNNHGVMRISFSKKRDIIKLISTAAHEVAHIVFSDHDERFANLLNNLLEECMSNMSEIINNMKEAKNNFVYQR